MTRWALDPAWLAGAVPGAVVCVRGSREVEVAFDADDEVVAGVVAALARGCDAAELAHAAQASEAEARTVLERLAQQGALVAGGPSAREADAALAAAIRAVLRGEAVTRAWTADELLVLPRDAGPELGRQALRAFVAGLRPGARLSAYAHVAATGGRGAIAGDAPGASAAADALAIAAGLDPGAIHVVALDGGPVVSVAAGALGDLGFDAPHRLGPLLELRPGAPAAGGRATAVALHSPGSLRHARTEADRLAHGAGDDAAGAALVARAEAAERRAIGDPGPLELLRARPGELADPVLPGSLHRWSSRQLADHPDRPADGDAAERLWAHVRTAAGAARWVPAEAVLMPFDDPACGRTMELTSSGAAAHSSFAAAAENAVLELIERDAFLWTWVQRVARERIDPRTLPDAAAQVRDALRRDGHAVDLVNLTLDTCPVVLAVAGDDTGLLTTCAADADPARAAVRALREAAMLAASLRGGRLEAVAAEDVRTPEDHVALHRDAGAREAAAFLTGSADVVDVREVAGAAAPPLEAVRVVGEPLLADLTAAATRPFHVARALVPGLVPMSFGWDREPLGMPRLAAPVRTADGRTLGAPLDLEHAPAVPPHPFA